MKTKVRIFFVSDKNKKFVVGEVEYHINGAILESGISGSLKLSKAGRVGQVIDFGDMRLKAVPDSKDYSRLTLA